MEMIKNEANTLAPMTLEMVEYRIRTNVDGATRCLMEIGRALNDAKQHDLVPHGQWESWVQDVAHMEVRYAQRLMKVAREVEDGSAMLRLDLTKVEAILHLPEGEREAMAEKAEAESLTVRQLKDEIARISEANAKANSRAAASEKRLYDLKLQREQDIERANQMSAQLSAELTEERERSQKLQLRLQEELAKPAVKAGISPEAEKIIDGLNEELREAEELIIEKGRQLAELQKQARMDAMDAARDGARVTARMPQVDDIGEAVKEFMAEVGVIANASKPMEGLTEREKRDLMAYVEWVEEWTKAVRYNLGVIDCE